MSDPASRITLSSKRVWTATVHIAAAASDLGVSIEAVPDYVTRDDEPKRRSSALQWLEELTRLAAAQAPRGGVWRHLMRAREQLELPEDPRLAAGFRAALLRVGTRDGPD